MNMAKGQTFDIFAVSIPDSNVQMAVARIMVGADRYLSMQAALDQVKAPPVLLFKNTELKDAEQHIAKLKALGVGFRVVRADGTDDDSIMSDDDLPGKPIKSVGRGDKKEQPSAETAAISDILNSGDAYGAMPPIVSIQDAISHHHSKPHGAQTDDAHKGAGARGELTGFGSAGGRYGGANDHGIRAGVGMLNDLKKSEAESQKKTRMVSIILASIVVVFALLFYLSSRDKKFNVKKITLPATAAKTAAAKQQSDNKGGAERNDAAAATPEQQTADNAAAPERKSADTDNKQRNSVNIRHKQEANNYLDSAKTNGTDMDKQVAFYKIAISFNRYNLQAWYGLLQAYRDMGKLNEARATEAQMLEIFGNEVKSVNTAVSQFGELTDAYVNNSGTYRVEYKTKKSTRDEVLREVFNMTRAIRSACNCYNISIHASTGPGKGLTANTTAETSAYTMPEFSRQADVIWVD